MEVNTTIVPLKAQLAELSEPRALGLYLRTFPKQLAAFRTMVEERGARLRHLPFAKLTNQPSEEVVVDSRRGTIATLVIPVPSGGVQVVVQGFLEHRFFPGKSVALDGFYKYPDESIAPMSPQDFWHFD